MPQDSKESGFLDLVDFGGVAFSVETVIAWYSALHLECVIQSLFLMGTAALYRVCSTGLR